MGRTEADGWGDLQFCTPHPRRTRWTDDGPRERRQLKSARKGKAGGSSAAELAGFSAITSRGSASTGRTLFTGSTAETPNDHVPPSWTAARRRTDPSRTHITAGTAPLRFPPRMRLAVAQRRSPAHPGRRMGWPQRGRPAQDLRQVHRRPGPHRQAAHRGRTRRRQPRPGRQHRRHRAGRWRGS